MTEHERVPKIRFDVQTSGQVWKLIQTDYTLRLSLVAPEWATENLRAWNTVFAEGRKRGNAGYYGPALVEMEIMDADKRAEWSYKTCCEIWEIQGRTKSRPLFRAIFNSCLQPMFSMREACFLHGLELNQKRTGIPESYSLPAIQGRIKREMDRLRAKWNTTLEIATRDAENLNRQSKQVVIPSATNPPVAPIQGSVMHVVEVQNLIETLLGKNAPITKPAPKLSIPQRNKEIKKKFKQLTKNSVNSERAAAEEIALTLKPTSGKGKPLSVTTIRNIGRT